VGAQVVLLKRISHQRQLVNGLRGFVVGFTSGMRMPVVKFSNGEQLTVSRVKWPVVFGGKEVGCREQVPLGLAWALSVHKSQGMTLDKVEMDLSRCFEYGQAYVALSRVRNLSGISIIGSVNASKFYAHPKVKKFYLEMRENNSTEEQHAKSN
jgi:ATP-dependent DNA helicase PIF1